MNLHHPTPQPGEATDPQLDALLDEALAVGDVPAALQERVLALTDPAFNAQLDQALTPDALPDGLETRVLQRVERELDKGRRPVLATIGPGPRGWLGYAAAAAIVLATGVAFYVVSGIATPQPGDGTAETGPAPADGAAMELEDALAFAEQTEVDQRLDSLETRILNVSSESLWGSDDDFQRELWLEISPEDEGDGLLF